MKRLLTVTLLLLGVLFTIPLGTHLAHAVLPTGVVCIAPATGTQCPAPFTVGDVSVGSSFLVGIFVDNSQAMGGFDIYVSVDLTYLHPNSAALGTLIPTAAQTLTSICVNGMSQTGSCTVGSANGPGVVEATTIDSSGNNECGGNAPCSGMAFTINYTVVAKTSSTVISYPSALSCGQATSVTGTNVCVAVDDATGNPLPETIQTGTFTSLDPTANFVATPTSGPAPLRVAFDASFSAPTPTHTITSYSWTFDDGNTTILSGPTLSPTLSHIYYSVGSYRPSLQTTDNSGNVSSIVDSLIISVLEDNFTISANPTSLNIQTGANKNSTITLTSMNETSGTINLSNNSSSLVGINANWTSIAINLAAGRSASTGLMFSISSSAPVGTHNITITGTYTFNASKTTQTTIKHSVLIAVTVAGFNYELTNSGNINVIRGSSATSKITLILKGTIAAKPVTLSFTGTTFPTGVTASFSPTTVIPTTGGNSSILTIITTLSTPDSMSSTFVTVTGVPLGPTTNNTVLTLFVTDFSIVASPSSVSIPQGAYGNSLVSLVGGTGFNGNISLTVKPLSSSIIGCCNRTSVVVTADEQGLSTLYIIVKPLTDPGPYLINVTGATGPLRHSLNVTVTVPTTNFSASSAPSSLSITAGTTGTSTINLIGLNGFAGTITLSANSSATLGISTSLSATSVTITSAGAPVASTLTISITATTAAGTYAINVTATSSISHSTLVTLIITSPQSSVQLAAATISTQSVTAGESVSMTVSVTNSGTSPVNLTITMDVNSGTGSNVTVAQKTITLNPGLAAQMITLTWNTTQWSGAKYHVYARIIGSQTTTINQAQSAGTVALSSPPSSPGPANLSFIPWVSTGILAAIVVVLGLLLFRRRRPIGLMESA